MSDNGRDKGIASLRKQMAKHLRVHGVFTDLSPELKKQLEKASEYGDFRKVENEKELESIKALLSGYMFNEHVVVEGTVPTKDGGQRVVTMNHFDVMMKAITMFLNVINMQNKMWGIYALPQAPAASDNQSHNLTHMVHELQRIARREPIGSLPAPVKATVIENGS